MAYSLLHHNTFGIDARCSSFREYNSVEELRDILKSLSNGNGKFLHIGQGSNLLFTKDYDGTILHSKIKGVEIVADSGDEVTVRAGAGIAWDDFVAWTVVSGMYGLENLSLIPGEVGASAVQNIGAYGAEAGDCISLVESIEVATGNVRNWTSKECDYSYRHSIFKGEEKGRYVITHVCFKLSRHFRPNLSYKGLRREVEEVRGLSETEIDAETLRSIVVETRKGKLPDPAVMGSAGSFFMNPVVAQDKFDELVEKYPNMPHFPMPNGIKIPAGWMIDQCGWKGKSLGHAGVYGKQALVLVNLGGAKGEDIVKLSDAVRADVKGKFGIDIYPEVNFI